MDVVYFLQFLVNFPYYSIRNFIVFACYPIGIFLFFSLDFVFTKENVVKTAKRDKDAKEEKEKVYSHELVENLMK